MNEAQRILERARMRRVEFEQIKTLGEDLEETDDDYMQEEKSVEHWSSIDKNEEKENFDSLSPSKYGLRNTVKSKLDKLGKLYAGEEVSSPIHKSLENDNSPKKVEYFAGKLSQARSARLAALANTINNWEDDLSHSKKSPTKTIPPAKPKALKDRNIKETISSPNKAHCFISQPVKATKKIIIEDSIAKTLEAQGFQRCESKQHLVYDYKSPSASPAKCLSKPNSPTKTSPIKTNPNIDLAKQSKTQITVGAPLNRFVKSAQPCEVLKLAAKYETATSPKKPMAKDPAELSLADRKALFERGDATAILPKAPFAMAVPPKILRNEKTQSSPLCKPLTTPPANKNFGTPTAGDNVTKEILERRREIEELRNRWDRKRKEVQDVLPAVAAVQHNKLDKPESPSKTISRSPPVAVNPLSGNNSYSTSFTSNTSFEFKSPRSPIKQERKSSVSPGVKIVLETVKPIKVSPPKGLYPNIADIETDSDFMDEDRQSDLETISESAEDRMSYNGESLDEMDESSTDSHNSSLSFGKHVVASSRENSRSNLKRPLYTMTTPPSEEDTAAEASRQNITADESRVLHEIDDFLDEALADDPTPPKKIKENNELPQPSTSDCNYGQRTPVAVDTINVEKEDNEDTSNTPLMYRVSMYRKQQTNLIKTPIKREVHTDIMETVDEPQDDPVSEEQLVKQKMQDLQIEIKRQVCTISQASQALNLCMSSIEFSGSTEELEAEKLLLLATARRMVATHELERLTVEKKLNPWEKCEYEDGTLNIESLSVKAKRVPSALDETIHLLCLVKSGCTVQVTEILPLTRQALTANNRLIFKKPIQIKNATHNLQTTVEVYAITNKGFMNLHNLRAENNKEKLKLTPKKAKKENKKHFGVIESPAGPNAIRSPSFQMIGFMVFTLKDISRNQFTLNKVPGSAPIEGYLEMKVKGQVNLDKLEHKGFLTLFREIGGFGAWKRSWCILKGYHLSFCSYADPERALASCFETIDLSTCITHEVGLAPKKICVRSDTLMLECIEMGKENEIVRYLISADSLKERLEWCNHINKVLKLLRLWNPINKL